MRIAYKIGLAVAAGLLLIVVGMYIGGNRPGGHQRPDHGGSNMPTTPTDGQTPPEGHTPPPGGWPHN